MTKRKTIKRRTYNNFLRILREIEAKGYDRPTAEEITRNIFDRYEANPEGLPIWGIVDQIREA